MLFWTNFVSLPLVTHFHTSRDPPKVRHTSQTPQFFVVHAYIHMLYREVCLSSRGFLSEVFCLEGFVRGSFCPSLYCQTTPVTTESYTSLSILSFICMKKFKKCDVTCYWTTFPCHKLSHLLGPPPPRA